jgi:hypothetical protein
MFDKEKLIYVGAGILIFLVVVNSTRKVVLKEVVQESTTKSFSSSSLPFQLRPPVRLDNNEPLPSKKLKKNLSFNSMTIKPRLDT